MDTIHKGKIRQGRFLADYPTRYKVCKDNFEGKRVEKILRGETKKRTNPQNNYLWGVVYKMIGAEIGEHPDRVHQLLAFRFLRKEETRGEFIESTTKLSTEEFNEYISNIKIWSMEFLNVDIPDPNEVEI